jgi:hypothetical protein
VLGTVARLYFEANTRSETDADPQEFMQVGQEFDAYLGALGLPNNSMSGTGMGSGGFQADVPVVQVSDSGLGSGFPGPEADSGTAAQLGNWFWGNQYMMGLLEEDLSQFNPGWS